MQRLESPTGLYVWLGWWLARFLWSRAAFLARARELCQLHQPVCILPGVRSDRIFLSVTSWWKRLFRLLGATLAQAPVYRQRKSSCSNFFCEELESTWGI